MILLKSVKTGLTGGAAVAFYFVLLYFSGRDYFLNPFIQWASMGVYLYFMWQAAKTDCHIHGSARDFREIVRTPFIVFLLINLCYWMLYYALHLFDPKLVSIELNMELADIQSKLQAGVGDPQMANALREREVEIESTLNSTPVQPLGPIINRMFMGALGGFAISAVIAAIIRSRK